jgi:hypothetical protein
MPQQGKSCITRAQVLAKTSIAAAAAATATTAANDTSWAAIFS